jgi:hypothetical protein
MLTEPTLAALKAVLTPVVVVFLNTVITERDRRKKQVACQFSTVETANVTHPMPFFLLNVSASQ